MKKKVCPMMFADTEGTMWTPDHDMGNTTPECLEDGCAWWDSFSHKCVMLSVVHWVREIASGGES